MSLFGLTKEARRFLERMEQKIDMLGQAITALSRDTGAAICAAKERHQAVMATVQEFKDALTEQNNAILAEVQQINDKLAQAGNIPADVLASLKANTQAISDIVADPLPEPVPDPPPAPPVPPEGRRR